jgi:hypothetical protein
MGDKFHKGRFHPQNPEKYKGDVRNIIYRSSWELKFMKYCDRKVDILEWGSEEFFIPYVSPMDGKVHKYFPDFFVKLKERSGQIKKYVIEVKPKSQTKKPIKTERKRNKTFITEALTYEKNVAKWKAAQEWCQDRMLEFKIITEDELGL